MTGTLLARFIELMVQEGVHQAGPSYPTGWLSTRAIGPGQPPIAEHVNVFPHKYEPSGSSDRPSIYFGVNANEGTDELERRFSDGEKIIEYRVFVIPMIYTVQGIGHLDMRNRRDQLKANILDSMKQFTIDVPWYEMQVAGPTSGGRQGMGLQDRQWSGSTGGAAQGYVEGSGLLPISFRYEWIQGSPP